MHWWAASIYLHTKGKLSASRMIRKMENRATLCLHLFAQSSISVEPFELICLIRSYSIMFTDKLTSRVNINTALLMNLKTFCSLYSDLITFNFFFNIFFASSKLTLKLGFIKKVVSFVIAPMKNMFIIESFFLNTNLI